MSENPLVAINIFLAIITDSYAIEKATAYRVNLPRVLATYEDGGALHIVTELCDGGTLLSHIGGNETEHTSRRVGPGGSFESSRSSSFSVERGVHSLTGGDSQKSSGTSHNEARLAHLFAQLLDAVRHLHDGDPHCAKPN